MRKVGLAAFVSLVVVLFAVAATAMLSPPTETAVVTIQVDPSEEATCLNPGLMLNGELWQTNDTVPSDTLPGTLIEGVLSYSGDQGTFNVDGLSLDYRRQSGKFADLRCAISGR